ncbi:hypothetical protein [Lelliottia nimipressuralis]
MDAKISFLFPYTTVGINKHNFSPVLTFECDVLPVKAVLQIAFYFICLKNKENYRLRFDILRNGTSVIDDSWDRDKIFMSEDPSSEPDKVAVGLNIDLPSVPFDMEGIYQISAELFYPQDSKTPIHQNDAFFKVTKKAE